MEALKNIILLSLRVGITLGFLSISAFGLGLMLAVLVYPVSIFWGIVIFIMGLLGFTLGGGILLTQINEPHTGAAPQ